MQHVRILHHVCHVQMFEQELIAHVPVENMMMEQTQFANNAHLNAQHVKQMQINV